MSEPNVSRRCAQHYERSCKDPSCQPSAARPGPKATPGAPEISWGQSGRVHKPAPPAHSVPVSEGGEVKADSPALAFLPTLADLKRSLMAGDGSKGMQQ